MAAADPVETFRQEAQDLLEQLESALLDLEQSPGDRELIDQAFRALHTIKGSGAMFGFDAVAAFAHHLENAFDQVRKGQLPPSASLIAVALASQDLIARMIANPGDDHAERSNELIGRLAEVRKEAGGEERAPAGAATEAPAVAEEATEQRRWRIRFRLAEDAMAMGTNPLLLLDELRGLGHCTVVARTEKVPPLNEMLPENSYMAWDVVLSTDAPRTVIEDVFIFVRDGTDLSIEAIEAGEVARVGEILVQRGDVPRQAVEEVAARRPPLGAMLVAAGTVSADSVKSALAEQKHVARERVEAAKEGKAAASIRVPAERLDELMDRVGELVISQARLKQLAAAGTDVHLKAMAEEIERLAAELRETTMSIRMVPIGSLFSRFRRLVHDLSRDLGKQVRLVTSGEETELDKTVIERLNDPLVHLIRNTVDHGIEPSAAARVAAGKPAEGEVRLEAWHAGTQVVISVSDDGRGLDRAAIQAKAEESGLIQAGAKLSDDELFQLIFQPGFSTAREITNVSGRGVGMDVVRRTIESLHGSIDVSSSPGKGTTVLVRLPLTLAIIDGLLVRVGGGRYVIPLSAVEECVELTAEQDVRSRGRSFLNIRGELVPFLRLRELFKVATAPEPYAKVVIVSCGDLRVGLVVDQIIGDHQTVIKSLTKLHADVETFSGATILGDGSVALILDVEHLIEFGQAQEERLKAAG